MTNEMRIFGFCEYEVRTILRNGEPWFVAKDVCNILGLQDTNKALLALDDDEKCKHEQYSDSGRSPMLVNKAGLYTLIIGSRKPKAKAFKRWVTHEVIPSIRKHGAYMTSTTLEQVMADPKAINGILLNLEEERNKRIEAEQTIDLLTPKVEVYDKFMNAVNTFTLTDVAKCLGMSGVKLCRILREIGILIRGSNNSPYQKYLDKGYFKVVFVQDYKGDIEKQTRVTPMSVGFIGEILKLHEALNA